MIFLFSSSIMLCLFAIRGVNSFNQFTRPNARQMGRVRSTVLKDSLAGTVKKHFRHALVALPSPPSSWPSHVENSSTSLATLLRCSNILPTSAQTTKPRIASGGFIWDDSLPNPGIGVGDILVLPDNVVLKWPAVINEAISASENEKTDRKLGELDLDNEQLASAASALFDNSSPLAQRWPGTVRDTCAAAHILVCVHGSRDVRCGEEGVSTFNHLTSLRDKLGLRGLVGVHACSHVGGHIHAANVIVYPNGDWFGHFSHERCDILMRLLALRYGSNKVRDLETEAQLENELACVWRGRVGLSEQEQREKSCLTCANRDTPPTN